VLVLLLDGSEIAVSLDMYAKLYAYCVFRPRTSDLVPSLRSRGVQFAKELGLHVRHTAWVLPGTVALAMQVLGHEQKSFESIGGLLGQKSNRHTDRFQRARVPAIATRISGPQEDPLPELLRPGVRAVRHVKPMRLEINDWVDKAVMLCVGGWRVRGGRSLPAAAR
jgi:hypothetical protein